MLVTNIKTKDEVEGVLPKKLFVMYCIGCAEVMFPMEKAKELVAELAKSGHEIVCEQIVDYVCRASFTENRLKVYKDDIDASDAMLNFSCGVGTQTLAELCDKPVYTGCNTVRLAGYAGLRANDLDCDRCGDCVIGYTAGICPIANCAKGLANGQCGGAMDGKCEIDKEKDCIWLLIYNRLSEMGRLDVLKNVELFRDYSKYELRPSLTEEEAE